jgi:hypothetical protein
MKYYKAITPHSDIFYYTYNPKTMKLLFLYEDSWFSSNMTLNELINNIPDGETVTELTKDEMFLEMI